GCTAAESPCSHMSTESYCPDSCSGHRRLRSRPAKSTEPARAVCVSFGCSCRFQGRDLCRVAADARSHGYWRFQLGHVGHQRDAGSKYYDENANPDPDDQGIDKSCDGGLVAAGVLAVVPHVLVFAEGGIDRYLGVALIVGFVVAQLRVKR